MPVQVNTGAMCQCMFGANPLPLSASGPVNAGKTPALNIMDIPKGVFGICNSPSNPAAVAAKAAGATAPCTPAFVPPMWVPGSSKVILRKFPDLTNNCTMTCALGAPSCITILPPGGAVNVQVK